MLEPERVPPQYARQRTMNGEALLVCAYDDEERFKRNHLEGAISYAAFRDRAGSLPPEQEIIFYCA